MTQTNPGNERRLAENALLRQLVDALKLYIAARDGLWSLSLWDSFFRTSRYRDAHATYNASLSSLNALIRAMAFRGNNDSNDPVLSTEEFSALMRMTVGEMHETRDRFGSGNMKKRKSEAVPTTAGPGFSPIVPPPSSIAPIAPSGANTILDQAALLNGKGQDNG